MKGTLWLTVVVVLFFGVGMLAIGGTVSDSADEESAGPESYELAEGETATLDEADDWYQISWLLVEDAETGDELEEDVEFEFNPDTGELTALENIDVDVEYDYLLVDDTTEEQRGLFEIVEPIVPWIIVLTIFGAGFGLLARWS